MLIATIVRVTGHAYRADITDASAVFVCEFYTNFIVRFFFSRLLFTVIILLSLIGFRLQMVVAEK